MEWAIGSIIGLMVMLLVGICWDTFNLRDDMRVVREVHFRDTYAALMRIERVVNDLAEHMGEPKRLAHVAALLAELDDEEAE
jgi:hypothetical protein